MLMATLGLLNKNFEMLSLVFCVTLQEIFFSLDVVCLGNLGKIEGRSKTQYTHTHQLMWPRK